MENPTEEGDKHEGDLDITEITGGNGRWQKITFIFFLLACAPSAWQTLVISFLAPPVKFWCEKSSNYTNVTNIEWIKTLEVLKNTSENFGQCHIYKEETMQDIIDVFVKYNYTLNNTAIHNLIDDIDNKTQPCQNWVYDTSQYSNNVVSEWNLVCEKEWLVSLSKSVYMAGSLISHVILGHVADRFGRKPIVTICFWMLVISAVSCAFSNSFIMFTITRFFIAFGNNGYFQTSFVYLIEISSPKVRSFYGIAVEFGWAAGFIILPAMAWIIRDWKWLQLAIAIPYVLLVFLWWFAPESPRWLLTQGKLNEAKTILCKMAKSNGKDVQDMEAIEKDLTRICTKIEDTSKAQNKSFSILDFLKAAELRKRTLIMFFMWFVSSFIYYGFVYNTNDLDGNPFINFAISGALEFPAYIISVFIVKYLGRRKPIMIAYIIGGVSCILTILVKDNLVWMFTLLVMFGKFCITAVFAIIYVYATEIFPTVIRTTGLGWCIAWSSAGSIIAPFVKELGQYTYATVPLICFGVLSIISGILVMLLPETHNMKVPDTLEDIIGTERKKKKENSSLDEKFTSKSHVT